MAESGLLKVGGELSANQQLVTGVLGPEIFDAQYFADYDFDDFAARGQFAVVALEHATTQQLTAEELARTQRIVQGMNNLQWYVGHAEQNPDDSMLRTGQIPLMRDLADFFERDAAERQGGFFVAPTSVGKMFLIKELVHITGLRALIVEPTKDLEDQVIDEFAKFEHTKHMDVGRIDQHEKREGRDATTITYASYSLQLKLPEKQRALNLDNYDMVLFDEVHELLGQERRKAARATPHAIVAGFTATDSYTEKKQVADVLPVEISRLDTIEAQRQRLVAPHHNIVVRTETDMRSVRVASTGEYAADVLYQTINTDARNKVVVDTYLKLFAGKKAIAFCGGIEHAKHLAKMFRDHGIAARAMDGDMPMAMRRKIRKELKLGSANGGIDIVTNDRVIGAGFSEDTVEVGLMVAPTLSSLKLMQNGGRPGRLWDEMPGKVSYVVQFIDQNYVQPPIIFAEEAATGYAQHGWEGFVFPSISARAAASVADTTILLKPEDVEALARDFGERRNMAPPEPPENWVTTHAIAEKYNVSKARVTQAINRLEAKLHEEQKKLEIKGEDTSELFDASTNKGKFQKQGVDARTMVYVSPELVEQLKSYIETYRVVPSPYYRSNDQLAALYDYSTGWVTSNMTGTFVRNKYDEKLWGKYVPDADRGGARWFFSPRYIAAVARDRNLPNYAYRPPVTWELESKFVQQVGQQAYESALRRFRWRVYARDAHAGRLLFKTDEGPTAFCSQLYMGTVLDLLDPNSFYYTHSGRERTSLRSLTQLARNLKEYGVTVADLGRELELTTQKDPKLLDYECGIYIGANGDEYHCLPELAAHIQERALRAKLPHLPEEEVLALLAAKEDERSADITERLRALASQVAEHDILEGSRPELTVVSNIFPDKSVASAIETTAPENVETAAKAAMAASGEPKEGCPTPGATELQVTVGTDLATRTQALLLSMRAIQSAVQQRRVGP